MTKRMLTQAEALESLQRYFNFEPVHDISGRFLVNIWRIYDILNADAHHAARSDFIEQVRVTDPELYDYLSRNVRWRRDRSGGEGGPSDTPLFDAA